MDGKGKVIAVEQGESDLPLGFSSRAVRSTGDVAANEAIAVVDLVAAQKIASAKLLDATQHFGRSFLRRSKSESA